MTSAFAHAETYGVVDVDGKTMSYLEHGGLLVFCNLLGLPALTAPSGHDGNGLPVGIQIVGPQWSEIRLLEIARALEQVAILPGFKAPPES